MKAQLLSATLALSMAASVGLGAPAATPAPAAQKAALQQPGAAGAENALKAYYGPSVQMHKLQQWDANGQTVEYYAINANGGQASATATSGGELMTTGLPVQLNAIPQPVQQSISLFKSPPSHLVQQEAHNYFAAIKAADGKPYVVEVNPVGEIVDIKSDRQLREDASAKQMSNTQLPPQVLQIAQQKFKGQTIDGGAAATNDPGYYSVFFHDAQGHGWAILNPSGDVLEWRSPVPRSALPVAVQNTLANELQSNQITNIERGSDRIFQATEQVAGDSVVVYLRPNGNVEKVVARGKKPAGK